MIYSTEIDNFPASNKSLECHTYKDENSFEWKIARVENGFFLAYFGDPYFKEKYFLLEIKDENIMILNSGCFFIQNTDFDVFCNFDIFYNFRTLLKEGWTDDIWESIGNYIKERLIKDPELTECETLK